MQLEVFIDDADTRVDRLPHTLLASNLPASGKTTFARLIAQRMEVPITMLVPPFSAQTLYDAAMSVQDGAILFIDESLALDTPVPTPTGWTTVGELAVGDQVFGASGRV